MKTILKGLVGSRAYGLETENSDYDYRGAFVTPTRELFRVRGIPADTVETKSPDGCYYEAAKFIRLAAQNNPNVLELLYLTSYEEVTTEGSMIIDLRDEFLSQNIMNTYGGYAWSQAQKLIKRGDGSFSSETRSRYSKHARHCFRLLAQGKELLETGNLTVRVSNREELFEIGELPPEALYQRFSTEFLKFKATKTDLPKEPNWDVLNDILLLIRNYNNYE